LTGLFHVPRRGLYLKKNPALQYYFYLHFFTKQTWYEVPIKKTGLTGFSLVGMTGLFHFPRRGLYLKKNPATQYYFYLHFFTKQTWYEVPIKKPA
jgi:hypothetical protein